MLIMPLTGVTFTSVDKTKLQLAFAIAHKGQEDFGMSSEARDKFKAIAQLIWDAHGEKGKPPMYAGEKVLDQFAKAVPQTDTTECADCGSTGRDMGSNTCPGPDADKLS